MRLASGFMLAAMFQVHRIHKELIDRIELVQKLRGRRFHFSHNSRLNNHAYLRHYFQ